MDAVATKNSSSSRRLTDGIAVLRGVQQSITVFLIQCHMKLCVSMVKKIKQIQPSKPIHC